MQETEVENDDRADEGFENQEKLALRDQVGLAGLVDQLGDFEHGAVDRHVLELPVHDQSEEQTERDHKETVT